MALLLFGVMALNFGISWLNAWSVGKTWAETQAAGGWAHVVNWSAAIMSAAGFTWVYLALLAMIAGALGLEERYVEGMLNLGYLIIILPVLGSGLTLTVHSWARAYRERSLANIGVAGWNTFAQTYNTVNAIRHIPRALEGVGGIFSGGGRSRSRSRSSGKGAGALVLVLLVILALVGGALTTTVIVRSTMKRHASGMLRSGQGQYQRDYEARARR